MSWGNSPGTSWIPASRASSRSPLTAAYIDRAMPVSLQSRPSARRFWRDLGLAFLGCFFTLLFLIQPYKVEGSSMLPALLDQERILVQTWLPPAEPIQRGDIIVFKAPMKPGKSFVKRVIGVPGDIVELRLGEVVINGRRQAEFFLPARAVGTSFAPQRVGEGLYFVLGDHRTVSSDSRHWGLVPQGAIQGKVILRYWPPSSFGFLS